MSTMDHAAAHEQIETLLLDPRRLAAFDTSTAPEDAALREHVAGCATCRADLDAWRGLGSAISSSLPRSADAALAATEPLDLPPSLRATVLAKVRAEPRSGVAAPRSIESAPGAIAGRRRNRLAPLLAIAAGLVLVVGSAFAVVDQVTRRQAAEAETAVLTNVVAAVDRVLAEPNHVVVQLKTPGGSNAGSISWSRHDWVVITNVLERPQAGQHYTCWLVDDDGSQRIGTMEFAGDTAFWVASVDRWATWEIKPTTRFVVTLDTDGSPPRTSPPILEAALGT